MLGQVHFILHASLYRACFWWLDGGEVVFLSLVCNFVSLLMYLHSKNDLTRVTHNTNSHSPA
ncbi:hypothetical protein EV363DRAFT_1127924, partial [Boletus edulis]